MVDWSQGSWWRDPARRWNRWRSPAYWIERGADHAVAARALELALLGAGYHVVPERRRLVVARALGRDCAIVTLPRSGRFGAEPVAVRSNERDLVLGMMTAMASALGPLRLQTAELGEIIASGPTDAPEPNAGRVWAAKRRRRARR